MNSIQENVEWLIPSIQSLALQAIQLSWQVANLEFKLSNLPEVLAINAEIRDLRKLLSDTQKNEAQLREQWKDIMMQNNLKEFTTLDWTVVSLQFTPGALVVEEWAFIPDEYWKVQQTRSLDKKAVKDALIEWKLKSEMVYIQKDCKLNIKSK